MQRFFIRRPPLLPSVPKFAFQGLPYLKHGSLLSKLHQYSIIKDKRVGTHEVQLFQLRAFLNGKPPRPACMPIKEHEHSAS